MTPLSPRAERNIARIRELNDLIRTTFSGGHVLLAPSVRCQGTEFEAACLEAVKRFNTFTAENDPHGEHDFGTFTVDGIEVLWKIEYYDRDLRGGSEDPADPLVTARVLTIMQVEEY
jgi:hypothetical protein